MNLKILICGSNGQLGNEMKQIARLYPDAECLFTDVEELDITNADAVELMLSDFTPDFVVNCAAYTAVDKAETENDLAMLVNATAPFILATACKKAQIHLIHVSTDYVFDGKSHVPYLETDAVAPNSFYGLSKQKGEENIFKSGVNSWIIRTSWLYSSYGHNFLKTILHHGAQKTELKVVFDQIGSPTYANDLAKCIFQMMASGKKNSGCKIYHFSNEGVCSWYDFALAIVQLAGLKCLVLPITSDQYPLPAPRPHYSVLNKSAIKKDFGIQIPHWTDGLKNCYHALSLINRK